MTSQVPKVHSETSTQNATPALNEEAGVEAPPAGEIKHLSTTDNGSSLRDRVEVSGDSRPRKSSRIFNRDDLEEELQDAPARYLISGENRSTQSTPKREATERAFPTKDEFLTSLMGKPFSMKDVSVSFNNHPLSNLTIEGGVFSIPDLSNVQLINDDPRLNGDEIAPHQHRLKGELVVESGKLINVEAERDRGSSLIGIKLDLAGYVLAA